MKWAHNILRAIGRIELDFVVCILHFLYAVNLQFNLVFFRHYCNHVIHNILVANVYNCLGKSGELYLSRQGLVSYDLLAVIICPVSQVFVPLVRIRVLCYDVHLDGPALHCNPIVFGKSGLPHQVCDMDEVCHDDVIFLLRVHQAVMP